MAAIASTWRFSRHQRRFDEAPASDTSEGAGGNDRNVSRTDELPPRLALADTPALPPATDPAGDSLWFVDEWRCVPITVINLVFGSPLNEVG